MEEVASTAKLVDPAAVDANSALTATLPRSDIEAALKDDEGADLFLEIARIQNGERDDRRIKVAWTREDLEQLLKQASGDHVSLTFSEDELQRMLDDPDFEAHGLREKALVLTVAVLTAGAGAGIAQAQVLSDGGGGAAQGAAITSIATDASTSGVQGAVTSIATDASTSGVTDPAAAPSGGSITGPSTDVSTSGQPGAITGIATDASTSGEPGSATGFVTDTGSDATRAPATAPGGGGFSVPNSAIEAALAAGIALLITGAAFVGRSRRRAVQPA